MYITTFLIKLNVRNSFLALLFLLDASYVHKSNVNILCYYDSKNGTIVIVCANVRITHYNLI